MTIDVLNPKAVKLLQDLAALNLISIKASSSQSFKKSLEQIRNQQSHSPSLDDITKEVELVRSARYARKSQ